MLYGGMSVFMLGSKVDPLTSIFQGFMSSRLYFQS